MAPETGPKSFGTFEKTGNRPGLLDHSMVKPLSALTRLRATGPSPLITVAFFHPQGRKYLKYCMQLKVNHGKFANEELHLTPRREY